MENLLSRGVREMKQEGRATVTMSRSLEEKQRQDLRRRWESGKAANAVLGKLDVKGRAISLVGEQAGGEIERQPSVRNLIIIRTIKELRYLVHIVLLASDPVWVIRCVF